MARRGKVRMVKHHASQNHRNAKQSGHGKGKKKRLIKTAFGKGRK